MKIDVPALDQFTVQAVDRVQFSAQNEEVRLSIEIEPHSVTNRVLVAILDQERHGMAVGIYPATGEVCDLTNGGGVIGYLRRAPLDPNRGINCNLFIYRFGSNCVCSSVIEGESFLYPAFIWETPGSMTVVVGKENHNGDYFFHWKSLNVEVEDLNGVKAA